MLYIPKSLYDCHKYFRSSPELFNIIKLPQNYFFSSVFFVKNNSESYEQKGFFGTKFRGGKNFKSTEGDFSKRESTLGLTGWISLT